jgi:hypothetical protein
VAPTPPPPFATPRAEQDDLIPCPHCGERIGKLLNRCPHCDKRVTRDDEEDEEEADDRPWERPRRRPVRRDCEPHRGALVLVFGILSVVFAPFTCCSLPGLFAGFLALGLGIPSWVMGQRDLRRMAQGEVDPEGKGLTQGGMICGIIGTSLAGVMLLIWIAFVVFYVVMMIAAASSNSNNPPFMPPPPPRKFEAPVPRLLDYIPHRHTRDGFGAGNHDARPEARNGAWR